MPNRYKNNTDIQDIDLHSFRWDEKKNYSKRITAVQATQTVTVVVRRASGGPQKPLSSKGEQVKHLQHLLEAYLLSN